MNEFLVRHEGNYTVAYFAFGPQDAGGTSRSAGSAGSVGFSEVQV